jgi:hypothetical protein
MSSTHAIMKLDGYFRSRNSFGYYYKDAAINARSQHNEADPVEKEYLLALNRNPDLPERSGIHNGEYYFLMKKGEVMEEGCLRCHDTPDLAPSDLVSRYGPEKSFKRKSGEIISVISIRIPVKTAYRMINKNLILISALILVILSLFIILYYYLQSRLIFNPLDRVSQKTREISNDPALIGSRIDMNVMKEIHDFICNFNRMSDKLAHYQNNLEEKIEEKTRKLEENLKEIRELNLEKDKLFSIVAHDLRNPVGSILNLLELMQRKLGKLTEHEIRTYLDLMFRNITSLNGLLENLLLWARSQLNKVTVDFQEISLRLVIESVQEQLERQMQDKEIRLMVELQEDIVIRTDRNILEIVLRNIVSNAVKFTDHGGWIRLNAEKQQGDLLELIVTDSGIGMSEEKLGHLFQVDKNVSYGTDKEKGSGLGLILCREYLGRLEGTITVASQPGQGTRVVIVLPLII